MKYTIQNISNCKKAINLNYLCFKEWAFSKIVCAVPKASTRWNWLPFISNAGVLVTFRTITFLNHVHDLCSQFMDINGMPLSINVETFFFLQSMVEAQLYKVV